MERLVYQPYCGCQVYRCMHTKPNLYRIQYCPLHEAAPRMYEALKELMERFNGGVRFPLQSTCDKANEAIAGVEK